MSDPVTPYVRLASRLGGDYTGDGWASVTAIARRIIANPQAHIDALAEAGVLRRRRGHLCEFTGTQTIEIGESDISEFLLVVAPHVHEWRVERAYVASSMPTLFVSCDCGHEREVPNRLPIDVPE
jgi:hypothetical protein